MAGFSGAKGNPELDDRELEVFQGFRNVKALLTSEVHAGLKRRLEQSERGEIEAEVHPMLRKTLEYTEKFGKFKKPEAVAAVRELLGNYKFLEQKEAVSLTDLLPRTAQEAKALIPSLEDKFNDEDLQTLLTKIDMLTL